MKTFRVEIVRTSKAPDEWPFVSAEFLIMARDIFWAEKIAEETVSLMEMVRGAYGAMKVDTVNELGRGGM